MFLYGGDAVSPELALEGAVVRTDAFQKGVELGAVIQVLQMAELVEHYVVAQVLGKEHKIEVQIDVAQLGAAAPV